MVISTYQVNNVLRVYGNQLRRNGISSKPKDGCVQSPDNVTISADARRKSIINKITSSLVDKITKYGPQDNMEKEVFQKLENEYGVNLAVDIDSPSGLIFKSIDKNGETVNSLSIEDSRLLKYKLEEITRERVDKNML